MTHSSDHYSHQDFGRLIDRRRSDSVKWLLYGDDVLPLWVADMDFPSPEPVIRALRERVDHGVFGYGKELTDLRPVIVDRLQRLYGWQVAPEALVFVPGVVTGFNQAAHAVTSPGDGVLVQTPVYFPMLYAPGNAGCTLDEMELTRQADGSYEIDFDLMKETITDRTRIFLLCSPHNPVGRVFRREELEKMAEICLERNVVICSDEIHCDLVFPGHPHLPIASLDPEIADRTITLIAPSKTYNIAGLHFSVAIIQNAELRERYQAAGAGLVGRPGILSAVAALAAFRDGQPWLDTLLRYLEANRDYLVEYVNSQLPGVTMWCPEGTYLGWLNCSEAGISGSPHQFFLEKAQVAMNEGASFGNGGDSFVRLNFGCPRSILYEALERMKVALLSLPQ
jgi:cystathionine beta-lyase